MRCIIPGLEHVLFVDRRLLTLDIPGQKAITKDNVPVQIDALIAELPEPKQNGAAVLRPPSR